MYLANLSPHCQDTKLTRHVLPKSTNLKILISNLNCFFPFENIVTYYCFFICQIKKNKVHTYQDNFVKHHCSDHRQCHHLNLQAIKKGEYKIDELKHHIESITLMCMNIHHICIPLFGTIFSSVIRLPTLLSNIYRSYGSTNLISYTT